MPDSRLGPSLEQPVLEPGSPQPLGATWTGRGVNFAVLSTQRDAGRAVSVRCVRRSRDRAPCAAVPAPATCGTDSCRRIRRTAAPATGTVCTVLTNRVGHRFNPAKLLIDPCAARSRGRSHLAPVSDWRRTRQRRGRRTPVTAPRTSEMPGRGSGVRLGHRTPPNVPWRDSVIYELHVKGFTQLHPPCRNSARHVSGARAIPRSSTT